MNQNFRNTYTYTRCVVLVYQQGGPRAESMYKMWNTYIIIWFEFKNSEAECGRIRPKKVEYLGILLRIGKWQIGTSLGHLDLGI